MLKFILLLLLTVKSLIVLGNSIIIEDKRLNDLSVTPSLGRGYSPSSNTFHGLCYENIDFTKHSADFAFEFEDIDFEWVKKKGVSNSYADLIERDSLLEILKNVSGSAPSSKSQNESVEEFFARITSKWVVAKLSVKSYYHSLNESASTLSPRAGELLQNNNFLAFFQSCGSHYIKSIRRYSSFFVLYSMETLEASDDFASFMKTYITSIASSDTPDTEVESNIKKYSMKILVSGIGLNPDEINDLLPTDLAQVKETIKKSINAAKGGQTGRIIGLEIAPWKSNIAFQEAFQNDSSIDLIKTLNQEENSELVFNIFKTRDKFQEQKYRATSCMNFLTGYFFNGDIETYGSTVMLKNKKLLDKKYFKKASDVYNYLNNKYSYSGEYNSNFRYLDLMAQKCIQKLGSMKEYHWNHFSECKEVQSRYLVTDDIVLDHYCMPDFESDENLFDGLLGDGFLNLFKK